MVPVQPLERTDREELTIEPEAVERNSRIEQAGYVERVDVFWRAMQVGECEMALQQCADVRGTWVIDRDLALKHCENLRGQRGAQPAYSPRRMMAAGVEAATRPGTAATR